MKIKELKEKAKEKIKFYGIALFYMVVLILVYACVKALWLYVIIN